MKADLKAKKILVTAPKNYGQKLCRLIEKAHGIAYPFPTIETFINPDQSKLLNIFYQLPEIPHIILPSRMAIDAFFKTLKRLSAKPDLKKAHFYAFGKDAGYMFKQYHQSVACQPEEPGPHGVVSCFQSLSNPVSVILLAPKVTGVPEPDVIPNMIYHLEKTGAHITKIEAYITQANDLKQFSKAYQLLQEVDQNTVIAFTSTAEILSLLKYFTPAHLNRYKIACFGPYTGSNALKLGLHPVYIGEKYGSFEDFIEGMASL